MIRVLFDICFTLCTSQIQLETCINSAMFELDKYEFSLPNTSRMIPYKSIYDYQSCRYFKCNDWEIK